MKAGKGNKQVINQYHYTKQPYIHNYHTEVVHHHITENEFIPNYSKPVNIAW